VSDLKIKPGDPIRATQWNGIVDRLPPVDFNFKSADPSKGQRLILCKTTEEIAASTFDDDIELHVYESGLVDTFGLINNEDGTFTPVLIAENRIMLNPSEETMPDGTVVWAFETYDAYLVASVWPC
jgi:hypothetical protein